MTTRQSHPRPEVPARPSRSVDKTSKRRTEEWPGVTPKDREDLESVFGLT